MEHVLSYMTFIPVAGMVVVLLLPSKSPNLIRWVSAAFTVPPLLMACWLLANFDSTKPGLQFIEKGSWIPAYNIQYLVGVDGLSISMVLLTALLCFLCIFASWGIDKGVKGYFALFLLLDAGMMGVFVALDFFLFFIFWEVMLLPMYFLIGIWGGPRREYAAIKFFLYTLFGSGLMLLAILALYFHQRAPYLRYDGADVASQQIRYTNLAVLALRSLGMGFSTRGLDGALYRVCDQNSSLSVSHLATRRSRRSADGRLCHPGWHIAQDGHLRDFADQFSHAAGGDS